LRWAAALTPIIMLASYVAFMSLLGEVPSYDSLQAAIDAQKPSVADMTGSAVVSDIVDIGRHLLSDTVSGSPDIPSVRKGLSLMKMEDIKERIQE